MFFTAPYRNALQRFDQPFAAAIAQDVAVQVAKLAKQIEQKMSTIIKRTQPIF